MEFIIWIRKKKGSACEQQGDGAMPFSTAKRIAKEISHICHPRRSTRRGHRSIVLSHRVPWLRPGVRALALGRATGLRLARLAGPRLAVACKCLKLWRHNL